MTSSSPSKGELNRGKMFKRDDAEGTTIRYQKWWFSKGPTEQQTFYDPTGRALPPRDVYSSSDWDKYSAEVCIELEKMFEKKYEGHECAPVEFWRTMKEDQGAGQGQGESKQKYYLKCTVDLYKMREQAVEVYADDAPGKAGEENILYERYICRGPHMPKEPRADVGGVGITFQLNLPTNDIEPANYVDTSDQEEDTKDQNDDDSKEDDECSCMLTNGVGKKILDIVCAADSQSESDNKGESEEPAEVKRLKERRMSIQSFKEGYEKVTRDNKSGNYQHLEFTTADKSEIITRAKFNKIMETASNIRKGKQAQAEAEAKITNATKEGAQRSSGTVATIWQDIDRALDEAFDNDWKPHAGDEDEEEQVRLRVKEKPPCKGGKEGVAFVRPAFRMSADSTSGAAEGRAGTDDAAKHASGVTFPYFEVEINVPEQRLEDFREGKSCIGIGLIRMPLRSHEERKRQRAEDEERKRQRENDKERKGIKPCKLRNVEDSFGTLKEKYAEEPHGASVGVIEDSFGYYSDGKVKIGPFEGERAGIAWALPMAGDTRDTLFVPDAAELPDAADFYPTSNNQSSGEVTGSENVFLNPQLVSNPHDVLVSVPLPHETLTFDPEHPKQWKTRWGTKTVVGCGVNISNGELFFTRNNMWAGSPHYRVRGRVPANQVEFQPMVTLKGDCTDVRIRISWGATVQTKCIRASARLCGIREKGNGETDEGEVQVPRKSFDAVPINEIAYQSHFRGIIQHLEQECEVTLEDLLEREIDDVMRSYFMAQVLLHNADIAIGDFIEVARAKPVIAESPELGWSTDKHGIKGVVCQIPPPGGAATFYSDCLAKSYVIAVLEKDYQDDIQDENDSGRQTSTKNNLKAFLGRAGLCKDENNKAYQPYGEEDRRLRFVTFTVDSETSINDMFRESPNAAIYVRKATDACARSSLSRRFHHICTNLPRFCNNPIGAALASASACKEVIKECDSSMISKGQILELKEMSANFTQLACELVPLVSTARSTANVSQDDVLESVLFPRSAEHALGNSLQESAIAIALRLGSRRFCAESQCVEHIDDIWKGAVKNSTSTLKLPAMGDYFGKAYLALSENAMHNIQIVCDVDFILAPIVRFGSNVAMLVLLLVLHHAVVFEWVADWQNGTVNYTRFSTTEYCYIGLHMTFIMGEVHDVLDHYSQGKAKEYVQNMWNYVDLLMHSVFLAYFFLQLGALEDWYPQYEPSDLNYWAHRILGINCILLWVRFTSALSSNASLGPFIRMMSLMAKDVIKFLIFLGMYILGFAGTFYVWYFHAAKADDGRRLHEEYGTARHLKGAAGGAGAGGGGDGGYGSYIESCITMFKASLGDFSFDEFLSMDLTSQYFGIVLLIGFLFLGAIMLLNLLIAILSHTYEKVQDQIRETFCFDKAQLVKENAIFWEGARTNIKLPPPFNALSLLFAAPILFLRRVISKLMTPADNNAGSSKDNAEGSKKLKDNSQQLLSLFNATTFMIIFGTGTVICLIAVTLLRLVAFLPVFLVTLLWDSVQLCVAYATHGSQQAAKHASDSDISFSDGIFVFLKRWKSSRKISPDNDKAESRNDKAQPRDTAYDSFDTGRSNTHCILRGVVALILFPIVLAAAIVPPVVFLIINLVCFFVHFLTQGLFPTVYLRWREICDKEHLAFDNAKLSASDARERLNDNDFEAGSDGDKQNEPSDVVRACCCFWKGDPKSNSAPPSAERWTAEREFRGKRWWPLFVKFRRDQHMIKDAYSGNSVGQGAHAALMIEVGRHGGDAPKHEKITKDLARAVRDTALGLDESERPKTFCLDDFLSPVANREASRYYDVDYELFLEELVFYMIYRFPQPVLVPINKLKAKVKDIMTGAASKAEEPDTETVVQDAVKSALENAVVKTVRTRKSKKDKTDKKTN